MQNDETVPCFLVPNLRLDLEQWLTMVLKCHIFYVLHFVFCTTSFDQIRYPLGQYFFLLWYANIIRGMWECVGLIVMLLL